MRSAALVFGLAGAFFGLVAAATVTWLDAGELGAAAWELSIAHPPGFPVFTQLHGLVMHLIPLGDAGLRGALASGLVGAAALACLTAAGRALGVGTLAATAGALAVGASGLFALHATTIEVYTGAAAFVAAGLWLGLRLQQTGDRRLALALGLLVGLAAGQHAELRLFVGLLLIPIAQALRRSDRRATARTLAWALGFAVLGGLCVLSLPLRSAADPWRDWGNPETLGALWDHLWGRSIRLAYADEVGTLRLEDAQLFLGQLWAASPPLVVLGLGGLLVGIRRPGVPLIALVWLVDVLYATAINPMGLRDAQNGVPGLCALGLGVALALHALERVPGRLGGVAPWLGALTLILGLEPALSAAGSDRAAAQVLAAAADEAPPEALVLVASDNFASIFAFGQVAEGLRPDLAVVVRQHVGRGSSVGPVARRLPAALVGWHPGAGLGDLTRLTDGWPVRWEWARGLDAERAPPDLGPIFPWFGRGQRDTNAFPAALAALVERGERLTDHQSFRALASLAVDLGRWRQPRSPTGARAAFAMAVALEGDERAPRLELARLELQTGDPAGARARLDTLLAEQPEDAEALGLRGVVRANAGDLAGATEDWIAALALDAEQPEARVGLATLRRRSAP